MALETTVNSIHHVGNGITFSFPYDFRVDLAEDMNMFVDDILIEPSEYEVTELGNDNGGSVTLFEPGDAPAPGALVVLIRIVEATQTLVYPDYGPFPAASHEAGLDKLTMMIQQALNDTPNAIRVPPTDPPEINKQVPGVEERATKFIRFDEQGNVTMSDGTDVQETVKGIAIAADSTSMLIADNNTNPEFPIIGANNINGEAGLMRLTAQGDYPQFPGLPGGGLPIEVLTQTPFLLFAVPIDDGTFQPGTDSQEMLTTYRQSNPADPFGFVDVLGVNTPNQANRLLQLDEFAQVPADNIQAVGLRNRGIFRGDDLCDKPGDEPLECVVPDTRNPSERFPSLDYPPGDTPSGSSQWAAGDFFAITMASGEADGTMNLFTALGDVAPAIVTVEANDGITFIPEIRQPEAPFDILVHHGWYHRPGQFSMTTAALVSLNTAGYGFIIGLPNDDVQNAFNFIDAALAQFRADQSSFDTGGGTSIIQPASENVQLALEDLDQGAFPRSGGTITGDVTIFSGASPNLFIQPAAPGGISAVRLRDSTGIARGTLTFNDATGEVSIQRFNAAGALETTMNLLTDGNVFITGPVPLGAGHITRMDFVQAQDAIVQAVADAALAAAGVAQSAAEAANANANTRKPEFDFIRSGDRLDINNVRTS